MDKQHMISELQAKLKADPELFYAYQANIAMFVYDALMSAQRKKRQNGKHGTEYLSNADMHKACNEGAVNFLTVLIKQQ